MAVTMNANQATEFLKQVAAQSYGSGRFEGRDGGAGSIGMIGGKPVKFNTHWTERLGKATPEMVQSSNELREALKNAALALTGGKSYLYSDSLTRIYSKLGLDSKGRLDPENTSLLSRKVVADIVAEIDNMRSEGEDPFQSFAGVKDRATSSKGVDTKFATLAAAVAEKDAMIARYTSGDLTKADITALNAKPFGTPVPVKVKYPEDLASLQKDFDESIKNAGDGTGELTGLDLFFTRQFIYEIGGEEMSLPKDSDNHAVKVGTQKMNQAVKSLFKDDADMLRALDTVFMKSLSIFELGHVANLNNVSLVFSDLKDAASTKQSLKLSKNADGSYHVDYHKSATGVKFYRFTNGSDHIIMRENEGADDFWAFSLSFDIARGKDGKIVVKPSGDFSTVSFQLPEKGFKSIM